MEKVSGFLTMTIASMTNDVDNSSSSHSDNRKYNFIILGEGDTFDFNGSFGAPEKRFSINFSKANSKFCLSLHYNADNSYLLVMETNLLSLKSAIKMLTFQHNFLWEVLVMDLVILSLEKYL